MAGQNRTSFNNDFVEDRSRSRNFQYGQQPTDPANSPFEPPYKIYVGNLPMDITQGDIAKVFEKMELEARNIRLGKSKENDAFLGYCYVEFDTENALKTALGNNGLMLNNKVIKINLAQDKRKNNQNRGGGYNNRNNYGRGGGGGGQGGYNMPQQGGNMSRGNYMGGQFDQRGGGQMGRGGGHAGYDRNQDFGNRNQFGSRGAPMTREYSSGQQRERGNYQSTFTEEEFPVDNDPASLRKKLVLKPRSVAKDGDAASTQRSSIFGSGKAKDHTASKDNV